MIRTTQKKEKNRCTTCKRSRRSAISEQAGKKDPCPVLERDCDFFKEIEEEIENRYKLKIVPIEKKKLNVTEKQKPKIEIVKRK